MGHKSWDLPWRRAERRRAKQVWREEAGLFPVDVPLRTSLEELMAKYEIPQAELDALPDEED